MDQTRLFDMLKYSSKLAAKEWLTNLQSQREPRLAMQQLIQLLVDVTQNDTSITIPTNTNYLISYNQFFVEETSSLSNLIEFGDHGPMMQVRKFFMYVMRKTSAEPLAFQQNWLTEIVENLHSMVTTCLSWPTVQVLTGYCCSYVLTYLCKERRNMNDVDVDSQDSFVTLCSTLVASLYHAYNLCLDSNVHADSADYFLDHFITEVNKNVDCLLCTKGKMFYIYTLRVDNAHFLCKILAHMYFVLTSETFEQKESMLRVCRRVTPELSYHICRKKNMTVVLACLKIAVEMHRHTYNGYFLFDYEHIYQHLFTVNDEIRQLTALLFVNSKAAIVNSCDLLDEILLYHFNYEKRAADNFHLLIGAFQQYEHLFAWENLFDRFDDYTHQEAKACHIAIAIYNVVKYRINEWNLQSDESTVAKNLQPLFECMASALSFDLGSNSPLVYTSLLQVFDIVNLAHFMHNEHLAKNFATMLESAMSIFVDTSHHVLAMRLCQLALRIQAIDPQAIDLNPLLIQICNAFILVWDETDQYANCRRPTMQLCVLLQHIADLAAIDFQMMLEILATCRVAFARMKSMDCNTDMQAFIVMAYAHVCVHLQVKTKLGEGHAPEQFAINCIDLFEWLGHELSSAAKQDGDFAFRDYMIFKAICCLMVNFPAQSRSDVFKITITIQSMNDLLDFLTDSMDKANDPQAIDQSRHMVQALTEVFKFRLDVPMVLPFKLFFVFQTVSNFDAEIAELTKTLLLNCKRNMFCKTMGTAIHRLALHKQNNPMMLVQRLMRIIDANLSTSDAQYVYTKVMLWVYHEMVVITRVGEEDSNGQLPKVAYSTLAYLHPLFMRIQDNSVLVKQVRMYIPIPRDFESIGASDTAELRAFLRISLANN